MDKETIVQYVAKAIAKHEGLEDEWEAYEDLAVAAIKSVKQWFEKKQGI